MKAWQLLDSPEKWTKGAFARTACGRAVMTGEGAAACWCLHGALGLCYNYGYDAEAERLRVRLGANDLVSWNDTPERTHQEVLAVLKELDI